MRLKLYLMLALMAATLLVYWQCGSHDFIILDDQLYVTKNPAIQGGLTLEGIRWAFSAASMETSGNWHPLTWISHMADIHCFALSPAGHHLTSVLIHTLNVALLFLVLCSMSQAIWCSAAVAALFALHPLHGESVAWVAERTDVLSTFFWMLTLLLYAYYLKRPGALRYFATLTAFVVGLMAKPMLVTLPVVMLCLDYWPLQRFPGSRVTPGGTGSAPPPPAAAIGSTWQALLLEKLPFLVVAAGFSVLAIVAQHRGGFVPDLKVYPLQLRLYNALLGYQGYLIKAVWPHDLAVYYPFPAIGSLWPALGSSLLLLFITAAAGLNLFRRPYLMVGWLWFVVTLLPVIGIIQVGQQSMADRYMYIPLVGLAIMAAWGIPELIPARVRCPAPLLAAAAVVLAFLGALTWRQLGYWRNSRTLLEHALQVTGPNYYAHSLLGNALFQEGNYQEALPHYQAAAQINPKYEVAHYKIGMISVINGDLDAAIRHLSLALYLAPDSENAGNARVTLYKCLELKKSRSVSQ